MSMERAHETGDYSQYLTFQSAGAAYAVGILQVKEIIPYTGATKVPLAPEVIRGLINLRGSAVAVVDLAVRFGAPPTTDSKRTCVVIVDVAMGDDDAVMGILADSVSEVIDVPNTDVDNTPSFGTGVASDYLDGLAKVAEDFIPIINVERVLEPNEALAAAFPDLDTTPAGGTRAGSEAGPVHAAASEPDVDSGVAEGPRASEEAEDDAAQ